MNQKIEKLKRHAVAHLFKKNIKIEELLTDLKTYIQDLEEENLDLRQRLQEFNETEELAKKNAEIQDLQQALRDKVGYPLTKKEDQELRACMNRHLKEAHPGKRWDYSYVITPTGLGCVFEARCNHCGEISYKTDNIG